MVEKNLRTRLVAVERNTFLEEKDTGVGPFEHATAGEIGGIGGSPIKIKAY